MRLTHRLGVFLCLCLLPLQALAYTRNIPEWYQLSAILENSPQVGVPVNILATLTAIIGDLKNSKLTLQLPESWTLKQPTQQLPFLREGSSHLFSWQVTPPKPSPMGSILCKAEITIPKRALIRRIRTESVQDTSGMAKRVASWPDRQKRAVDISFALLPEEGFYPLTADMWTSYDDRLKPANAKRGPAFYQDPLITPFQARTDVEMFDKLTSLLKSNPDLAATIRKNGINLKKKEFDFLTGLYVLATQSYLKGNFDVTLTLLKRLESFSEVTQTISVAAGNLRALTLLSQGFRKHAEDTFRKVFYRFRKHPLQRYILRNLGLLMLSKNDVDSAREMFRLALQLKPAYTILRQEFESLR